MGAAEGGEKGRGAGAAAGGEKGRDPMGAGEGVTGRTAVGGSGPGEFEKVRPGAGVEGDIGRGTSAGCAAALGGSGARENGRAAGEGRENADDCTAPGCALENVRPWIGRAVACANDIARASWVARVEGSPSAGTCASVMLGPRAAAATRYVLLLATLAVAAMYGRVRGAMAPTRSEGTMYPRMRGENTYLDEQNT
jgi:hypothetical protein